MAAGVGMFRVRASVDLPTATTGRHQLSLINAHHPESSVYLANALVPADTSIRILAQSRTTDQHRVTIDYELGRISDLEPASRGCWLLATLLMGAVLARRGLEPVADRPITAPYLLCRIAPTGLQSAGSDLLPKGKTMASKDDKPGGFSVQPPRLSENRGRGQRGHRGDLPCRSGSAGGRRQRGGTRQCPFA